MSESDLGMRAEMPRASFFNAPQTTHSDHHVAGERPVTGLERFSEIFTGTRATHIRPLLACHQVRYESYCIDNAFEDPLEHPDGYESDDYDAHSVHSLLTHRSTGEPVGTVRLVLPSLGGKPHLLPIQSIARPAASQRSWPFPIERTGEVSRFALKKSIRLHVPQRGVEAQLSPDAWRKTLACLPLGLIRLAIGMLSQEGMTHLVAVMEPSLIRHLKRFALHFTPIGEPVQHHGVRQPCWTALDVLLDRTYHERRDVWDFITDGGEYWRAPPPEASRIHDATRFAAEFQAQLYAQKMSA